MCVLKQKNSMMLANFVLLFFEVLYSTMLSVAKTVNERQISKEPW